MGFVLLFIGLTLLGLLLAYADLSESSWVIGVSSVMLSFLGLIVVLVVLALTRTNLLRKDTITQNKIRYDGLIKQIESVDYQHDAAAKAIIIKNVTEWNQYVEHEKLCHKNFWIGIFYPNDVVDDLEYIELE